MKDRFFAPRAASLLELQSEYMYLVKVKGGVHCHAMPFIIGKDVREEQAANSAWDNQHNEIGGDPTVRDVGPPQVPFTAASRAESIRSMSSSFTSSTCKDLVDIGNDSEESLSEPEPEMTTPKTDLEKSFQLLAASLWAEAYDHLKSQEPGLLKRYEDIIKLWLEGNSETSMLYRLLVRKPLEHEDDSLAADSPQWKQQISGVAAACLDMGPGDDDSAKTTDDEEPASQPRVRATMQPTLASVPSAVLPWAGMWLCLQVRQSYCM